ncbi:uncharacterized protein LOC112270208 [Brachypodium distachyon]|uniref:Late embryogenesis abundant protein LEA-2 subgroup domain-containing protein n=1 Tax=Brachypodium distachyon TaxID=15368 RepID=I1H6E3_BRADI|nr:uncharacterized protein LOC112270208 [Brachypodium distachyon]KQK22080.1 hypothetical protein BRADI_1g65040v3 [Brachypodium distachyon]|eukprot:XP_024313850.1 uncharacterized protein LOC112270208 [Brachypodium distachyon]
MTVHGDHDAGFSYPTSIITVTCEFAVTIAFAVVIPCYYMWYDFPPEFSVQLRPDGIGPNGPAAASISSENAFNVTLRADNRRATERCYREGEAVVTYAGFTVGASTRTPDFCVPRKQAREVPFRVAWDWVDGVGPEHLRDRFAAAEKVGAVELEVQLRLVQGDDKPVWMWCKVTMGTAGARDSPCSVFGLQNWLSDWPRAMMHLMQ